jgi:cellular nucleic acid-binding protein
MTIIYILRLLDNKWYVGKTDNIDKRYKDHVNGRGAVWTRKYRPINLATTIQNAGPFDEDKVTKEYMAKYGINNVRGGSYISETLDSDQITLLQREIWMAKDLCLSCGSNTHFLKDCNSKEIRDINTPNIYVCEYCMYEFSDEHTCLHHISKCKKEAIKFAGVIQGFLTVEEVIQMVGRYIRQQANLGRTNADFPLAHKYGNSIVEIALGILKNSSALENVSSRLINNAANLYIIRVEWSAKAS